MVFGIRLSIATIGEQAYNLEATARAAAYQDCHAHCKLPMPASLIGRLGSSAFRLSTNSSVDVAHGLALLFGLGTKGPSIMGIRRRGGTIFRATLPSM